MILTIRNFPRKREVNINYLIEREDNVNFKILLRSYRFTFQNNEMTYCHLWFANYEYYSVCSFTKQIYQDELDRFKNSISSVVEFLSNTLFLWGYLLNFLMTSV